MQTSLQTKVFAAGAVLFSIFPIMLVAQVAFDPLFPIAENCGLLVTWSALAAIGLFLVTGVSAAIDCFTVAREA